MALQTANRANVTGGEKFVRFTRLQRLQHWLMAATFLALVLTGLPQKFDEADISVRIINALGGIDNARFLHRVLATAFVVESLAHIGEIGLSILARRFRPSMVITFQDFRDAFNMLRYSVGLIPGKPRFDRYDYRQKFEYWGIVFGAIIMIATGVALWFPTYVTRILPGELVPAAKEMHSGEALLAFLVIVIWHFYDVVLSPSVFPLDVTMITGVISRERLHEEHPREFARLTAAPQGPPPPPGPPQAPPALPQPASRVSLYGGRWSGVIRRSLQWRVMILVTIGMAGILAAFSVSSLLAVNQSIDRTLEERQALAEVTAGHVDYVIRQGLKALEESTANDGFDLADLQSEQAQQALRRALSSSIFTRVYLTDASGEVLWTEPGYASMLGVDIGLYYPQVRTVLESRRPSISGLSAGMADGEPVVSMVAPIDGSNGEAEGLIAGDIVLSGSELIDMIRPAALGDTGYAQIVDGQGMVLASTRPGQLLESSDHGGQLATLIAEKRSSSGTCHECHEVAGGEERQAEVMAFAPLELAPWGVLIRQSEGEALAPARALRQRAVLFGVPAFVLALLFTWATARSVVRPVRVLTASAQRIAAGDLSEPVPDVGRDEVGSLARTFEVMRVRLKQSLESIQSWGKQLEDRVRERTSELEASRDHLRAVADENAALYEQVRRKEAARSDLLKKVITAQEEERRRIARELHDETSQALTVLVVGMETAALDPDAQKGKIKETLTDLRDRAVDTLEDIHRLIYDLRPSVLDDLGLVAGLRWYVDSRLQPAGVGTSVLVTGEERRLPPEIETALFRIGQEAVSNAVRHASPANVQLSIDFREDRVTLEVEDDGAGFDVAAVTESEGHRPGWGILGMRERATLFGGTLTVVSEPGSGTRVKVSIPLGEESGGDAKDSRPDSG